MSGFSLRRKSLPRNETIDIDAGSDDGALAGIFELFRIAAPEDRYLKNRENDGFIVVIFRTLHIRAALHAAFRWDKARRFTSNDLYDFAHASAALACCRAFFTEHALRATIVARNVALDELFQCRVVSEIRDAVEVLKTTEGIRAGITGNV